MCSSTSTPRSSATTSSTSSSTTPGPNSRRQQANSKESAMTTSLSANRRDAEEIRPFHAPTSLFDDLQKVLVDLIELHLQGKQAHWNVVGTNFRDLHLQLDELVDFAREGIDSIAERMRALDAVPDGRSDTVAVTTSLPRFPANEQSTADVVDQITTRIYATVGTLRA